MAVGAAVNPEPNLEPNAARLAALWAQWAKAPWEQHFFQALRELEALHPEAPRWGEALRPGAEPIRLGQDVELDFAPAALSSLERDRPVGPPRLGVRFFGLFGPMGPLPLHLTEFVRERQRHHNDPTLARFADVFHHRALLLFYRAWAQSQPTRQRDRPQEDDYARWVSAFIGLQTTGLATAQRLPEDALRHHLAHLMRGPRNAEGLEKLLSSHFRVPVKVQSHVGHWLTLRTQDRTRLMPPWEAGHRNRLGVDVVAGSRVWDRQYRFRIQLGPLSLAQYEQFLPGSSALLALRDWVRQFVGLSMTWEVQPILRGDEVPALQLRTAKAAPADTTAPHALRPPRTRLGLTTWLGRQGPHPDRGDLRLQPETDRTPPQATELSTGETHV